LIGALSRGLAESDAADAPDLSHEGDRKFVVALARGLEVLRAFKARDGFLTNTEIAERTGLPKPTVTRLTYTLCELGYLKQNPRLGKYQLAPGTITLGYAALANLGIRPVARDFMDEAAEALAAPVALGVLDRGKALYVDISRGSATFTVQLEIGSRIPLATTAMGRALLVGLDPAEREAHLARTAAEHPEHWPAIRRGIEAALESYAARGFVTSDGEWRSDINAVGVPLVAADGSGIYAFNCGAPPYHFPPARLSGEIGPAIRALARVVDDALNGRRPALPGGWLPAPARKPRSEAG
jgi:DNA-binding IclR family transcriptional regulator